MHFSKLKKNIKSSEIFTFLNYSNIKKRKEKSAKSGYEKQEIVKDFKYDQTRKLTINI